MKPRPNILLITTDQQRADHLGLCGLCGVATPNLDRLGREGIHFSRAYCPSPICTPTRVSLLTGQYPSVHGAYSIGTSLPEFPRNTLPQLLRDAGYRTGIVGKTHFVARTDESRHMAGTEDEPNPDFFRDWSGPYLGFESVTVSSGHTINTNPAQHYRVFLEDADVDWKPWFPRNTPAYDHHACGPWNIPPEYHDTRWVGRNTEAFINGANTDSRPWFCWASFQDPHEPFVCPEPWFSSVDTATMQTFEGYRPGEFDDRHPVYQAAYERKLDPWKEPHGVPSVFGTPERTARKSAALQATLGMIAFLDAEVGHLLQALERTGQLDNTLVVFTSDHGEMHGHHGLWGKGLTAYEDCQRVPLLARGPEWIAPRPASDSALISLVDLPATFLSLANIELPNGIQGYDWSAFLRGETNPPRDAVLVECRPTRDSLYQQSLITRDHKLVVYHESSHGELYDLAADPNQYRNLWNESDSRHLRESLLLRLVRLHMEEEGMRVHRRGFG